MIWFWDRQTSSFSSYLDNIEILNVERNTSRFIDEKSQPRTCHWAHWMKLLQLQFLGVSNRESGGDTWDVCLRVTERCKSSVHGGSVVYWHICFQLMLQPWSHSTSRICLSVGSYPEDIDIFHVFLVSLFTTIYTLTDWTCWSGPRFLWILYCRCWAFKMTQGHFWRCLEKRWRGWPCSFPVNEGFSRCSQIKVCKQGTRITDVCILICANEINTAINGWVVFEAAKTHQESLGGSGCRSAKTNKRWSVFPFRGVGSFFLLQ